ncbi:MAG: hypothetical protein AAF958_02685 [Planctomycetota bacterium]
MLWRPTLCVLAITTLALVVTLTWAAIDRTSLQSETVEGGFVEVTTLAGYGVVLAGLVGIGVWQGTRGPKSVGRFIQHPLLLAACVALLSAREMDWHKRFTSRDIFKTRFYVDPEIAASEKVLVSLFIIAMVAAIALVFRRYYASWTRQLLEGRVAAVAAMTSLGLMVGSKLLDSGMGIIYRAGLASAEDKVVTTGVEEISELAIPLAMVVAIAASVLGGFGAAKSLGQREDVQHRHRSAA